jgi:hypothetical protein
MQGDASLQSKREFMNLEVVHKHHTNKTSQQNYGAILDLQAHLFIPGQIFG